MPSAGPASASPCATAAPAPWWRARRPLLRIHDRRHDRGARFHGSQRGRGHDWRFGLLLRRGRQLPQQGEWRNRQNPARLHPGGRRATEDADRSPRRKDRQPEGEGDPGRLGEQLAQVLASGAAVGSEHAGSECQPRRGKGSRNGLGSIS